MMLMCVGLSLGGATSASADLSPGVRRGQRFLETTFQLSFKARACSSGSRASQSQGGGEGTQKETGGTQHLPQKCAGLSETAVGVLSLCCSDDRHLVLGG